MVRDCHCSSVPAPFPRRMRHTTGTEDLSLVVRLGGEGAEEPPRSVTGKSVYAT